MKRLATGFLLYIGGTLPSLAHPGHAEALAEPIGHWIAADHLAILAVVAAGGWFALKILRFSFGKRNGGRDG